MSNVQILRNEPPKSSADHSSWLKPNWRGWFAFLLVLGLGSSDVDAGNIPVALSWGLDDSGQLGQGTQVTFPAPTGIDQTGVLAGKTVVKTVSGGRHMLALTSEGKVYAWGDNSSRQLGNNSVVSSSGPVEIGIAPGSELFGKTAIDIAATQNTSFLITSDFQLWGWGTGALGGSTASATGLPIRINSGAITGKSISKIATGSSHAVVLTSDGVVASFGSANTDGQLGNNTTNSSYAPVAIVDANSVLTGKTLVDVSAGSNSSMARSSDGKLYVWGNNSSGQLGINDKNDRTAPVLVSGSLAGKSVTAMDISTTNGYAIASDNTLHSWGSNGAGALGIGSNTPTERLEPALASMTPFAEKTLQSVKAGNQTGVVRTTSGEVFTWGNNTNGALGGGFLTTRNEAAKVSFAAFGSGLTVVSVHADSSSQLMSAVLSDGRAVIWGHPTFGRSGSGLPFLRGIPVSIPVAALPIGQRWALLAAGQNHSLGVSSSGKVFSWGSNISGQLGLGATSAPHPSPQAVTSSGGVLNTKIVTAVAAGVSHSAALTQDGRVFSWGANSNGQLGNGNSFGQLIAVEITTDLTPVAGKNFAKIAAGNNHMLALTSDGVLVAWGANTNGQLGDGTTNNRSLARAVSTAGVLAGKTVVAIAANANSSYALTSDGFVFAWGLNTSGQLGDGTSTNSSLPVAVSTSGVMAGKTITSIAAAENSAYAIASDGTLFGWGSNSSSQLGKETTTPRETVPAVMTLPSGHTHRVPSWVNASVRHVNVVTTDGAMFSSGSGPYGTLALGENDFTGRTSLTYVQGTGKELGLKILTASSNGQSQHVVATAEYTTPEIEVQHPVGTVLTAGTAAISFGSAKPGINVQRSIRLANLGEADLKNLSVTISEPSIGSFSVIGAVPSSLSEDQSVTLIVQYAASALGSYSANLRVASSDPVRPNFDVALSGEVITPVSIQTPPSAQTVNPGTTVELSVVATGSPTITYQWIKNGVPIEGARSASLNLGAVTELDQGNYAVTVANAAGSLTTNPVSLSVNNPIVIGTSPVGKTVNPGVSVSFSVVATGTAPITYVWRKGGQPIQGADGASLSLGAVDEEDTGQYDVIVSNVVGSVTSSAAQLNVNDPVEITTPPASRIVNPGAVVSFSVAATGTGPFNYVWRKNGIPIDGADGSSLQLGAVSETDEGSYDVIVSGIVQPVTSSAATLTVNDPVIITTQPQSASLSAGDDITFSVAVTGTGPFEYEWRRNQTPIPGATGPSLLLENLQAGPQETIDVIVRNIVGSVTSDSAILFVAGATPQILQAPSSRLVKQGESATFKVTAIGQPPLRYQWQFKGKNLRGATAAELTLSSATVGQAGDYRVIVSAQQSVTSDSANLGVVAFQGGLRTLLAGGKTSMALVAAGAVTGFEWLKDGLPVPEDSRITGRNTSKLSFLALDSGTELEPDVHSGVYSCRVRMADLPPVETDEVQLKVFDSQPRLISPIVLSPAAIGLDYSEFIEVETNPQRAPQRFIASGLPPGLKINAITGEISGRPTASKPGGYAVKVTVSNSKGKVSGEVTLNVRALPVSSVGTFTAIVAPEAGVNANLGGQLSFAVQPSGALSGSIRLGVLSHKFKGRIEATLESDTTGVAITIPRSGRSGLQLSFTIDEAASPDAVVGEIQDPEAIGAGTSSLVGWRSPWTQTVKASRYTGLHTLALSPPANEAGNVLLPQGFGFGAFTVATNGTCRVTGKLSDGQAFAVPAFVGPAGQVAVFQVLYSGKLKGSLVGRFDIASGEPVVSPSANSLTGDLEWTRPMDLTAKSRLYPDGFSLFALKVQGSGYVPPAVGDLMIGLSLPDNLALLSFESALPADLPTSPDVSVRLLPRGGVQLPLLNPTLTSLKTSVGTGEFNGGFTVLDGGVRRKVSFQGRVVGQAGYGYFLLPQLGVTNPLIRSGAAMLGRP